ncbi:MAG: universal stress protein [Bacteroidetes bacterium]|nr:universal stress protein [Bacteroidota bacterium]
MKTILVPTDFSKCAYNAANYAVALAKATKAKVILLHVYQAPVPPPETYISPISITELYEANMKRLKKMADFELSINTETSELEINCEAKAGLVVSEIIDAAKKYNAGMIVMGTEGATGVIKKYILGSNAANVIAKSPCPVLAVPENAKYLGFKQIVFAADFHEVKNNSSFDSLAEISLLFDSKILILSVSKNKGDIPSITEAFEGLNLDKVFERIPNSFHNVVSEDTARKISDFVNTNNADLLVTMPQKHSYLELIFNKSITRDLVFHTQTPILCLPEKQ